MQFFVRCKPEKAEKFLFGEAALMHMIGEWEKLDPMNVDLKYVDELSAFCYLLKPNGKKQFTEVSKAALAAQSPEESKKDSEDADKARAADASS